jgi:hypothetical protein
VLAPGAVVCLEAGDRGSFTLPNAHGTSEQPITLVNTGGVVHITGDEYAGIWLAASSYVRVLGNGTDEHCGAPFLESDQQCGIVIDSQLTGRGVSATKKSDHVEVAFVEVRGGGEAGINIKTDSARRGPGAWVLDGISVHHTWIHDIQAGDRRGAEAIYLGASNWLDGGAESWNVEVAFNRTARIGWESYQVSSAIQNCRIHDNIAVQDSLALESGQVGSIKVKEGSTCDIVDNVLVDGGSRGITDFGHGGNLIARNVIIGVGRLEPVGAQSGSGIFIVDGDVSNRTISIEQNFIEHPQGHGISVASSLSSASTIQHNRICQPGGEAVRGGASATISDNGCSTLSLTATLDLRGTDCA